MSILLLIVALCISGVAAFYSVVGLAAIFSGSSVAVILMGGFLEVAKITTAAWLHKNWKQIPILLKTYLTLAVVVLMFITSIGIFGFLSKAHIAQEQRQQVLQTEFASLSKEQELITTELTEAKARIAVLQSNTAFDEIRSRITTEQQSLTSIDAEKQAAISPSLISISKLQSDIDNANQLVSSRKISEVQQLVGIPPDGEYGSSTKAKVAKYIKDKQEQIDTLKEQVSVIEARFSTQYDQTNQRIEALQSQLSDPASVKAEVQELTDSIAKLQDKQSQILTKLEPVTVEIQQYEVEIGPITFISELFFGSTTEADSRATVRVLIFIIIIVFDPLAVLLIVASSMNTSEPQEPVDDKLPTTSRLKELINIVDGVPSWKERGDKAFDARWANKPLGQYATIDGKKYKAQLLVDKLKA